MRYTLDANACILLLAGHPAVVERAERCEQGELAISTIVYAEIALGIARGKPPSENRLDDLLRLLTVLPFDEPAARAYALLPFKRGSFDRLIAAHAIAEELILVTANIADFADIPHLRTEDWTVPIT